MKPLVSILVPLYNAESFIEETILSVQSQTYSNWELIIVDDGSEDNGFELVKKYATKDHRICIHQQENQGACAARNRAFEISKGDYIQYLDSDDLLSKNKIEEQLYALVTCDDSNAIANCRHDKFQKQKGDLVNKKQVIDQPYLNSVDWLVDAWSLGEHGQTSCWLTPRHLIKKAGIWDESLRLNQDGEFFCRVLLVVSQILYIENVNVDYRMGNSNSISQSKKSFNKVESLLKSFHLYENHSKAYHKNEKVVEALLSKYFTFLCRFDRYYPTLSYQAWERIKILGENKFQEIVRKKNHTYINLFGFKNYLRLQKIKTKITHGNN